MRSTKSRTKQAPKLPTISWEFEAIGTKWWIGTFEPIDTATLRAIKQAIHERIEQFDRVYSRFRDDSLVTKISKQAGTYTFPDDGVPLFDFYHRLYEATKGAVTPLIGNAIAAAGYDATYSLQPGKLTPPPAWGKILGFTGREVIIKQPSLLDFGAAGKGYLVDLVSDLLNSNGLTAYCVDASGDMLSQGDNTLLVGLENPDDASQVIGITSLQNQALCGSAGNRRVWGDYHHIMDPFSLRPAAAIKATWVVADDAMTADGLATALFFVPPEALSQFRFEYVMVDATNHVRHSTNFPAELFNEEAS